MTAGNTTGEGDTALPGAGGLPVIVIEVADEVLLAELVRRDVIHMETDYGYDGVTWVPALIHPDVVNAAWHATHPDFPSNRTNSPIIPELLPDLDVHVEFMAATGVTEDDPDYAERFDDWVDEQRASQAISDLEADREMGRVA